MRSGFNKQQHGKYKARVWSADGLPKYWHGFEMSFVDLVLSKKK